VETNAAILQAYALIEPGSDRLPMLAKWLVKSRHGGGRWRTTKETAMAVYALADYLRLSHELTPEYTVTVALGDRIRRSYRVTRENALFFEGRFLVPDELLQTGAQTLTILKEGPGTLYYTAFTRYFSLEEPIRATSHELGVARRYYRLIRDTRPPPSVRKPALDDSNPFLEREYERLGEGGEWTPSGAPSNELRYRREPLQPGAQVASGDLIEVELAVNSPYDQEYVAFEDPKPAGCEPVEVQSGGGGGWFHQELRDQKVAFFVSHLPRGRSTLTYRLWAEMPGEFHVLPSHGYAMYAPDVRALSDEMTLGIH